MVASQSLPPLPPLLLSFPGPSGLGISTTAMHYPLCVSVFPGLSLLTTHLKCPSAVFPGPKLRGPLAWSGTPVPPLRSCGALSKSMMSLPLPSVLICSRGVTTVSTSLQGSSEDSPRDAGPAAQPTA